MDAPMSRPALSLLAALGLTGTLAAGVAHAQFASFIYQAPAPCAAPTPAQCHDPAYWQTACGQAELPRTRLDAAHVCNVTLQADAGARAAALPSAPVLIPSVTNSAAAVSPAGGTTQARIETRVQPPKSVVGMTTLYFGNTLKSVATASNIVAGQDVLAVDPNRPADNGLAVTSCAEYAREKYWDISLWEDAARLVGEDYRAMYTTAYGNVALRESIGERGRQVLAPRGVDNKIRARDGAIQSPNWDAAAGPKNTFFSTNLAQAAATAFPGAPAGVEQAYGSPLRLKGVVLADATLPATLAAGRAVRFENFQWHKDMSTALAGTLDEQLYTFDALKATYAGLLQRRVELVEKSRKELVGVYNVEQARAQAECQRAYNIAAHSANPEEAELQADELCEAAYAVRDRALRTAQTSVENRLASLDGTLEAALVAARNKGCLNTAGITACDWSPKLFVESVHGRYVKRREADHQACVVYTGNNFVNLVNAVFPGRVATNYTTSTTMVDTFIALRRAQVQAAVAALEGSLQPAAGGDVTRIGNKASDSASLGNADFGASWSYAYDWRVFGLQNGLCNVNASFAGDLDAAARVFGRNQNLLDAHLDADYTRVRAQVTVLDQSLVSVDQALAAEQYNLARSSTQRTNDNLTGTRPSAWFSLLGVPVRVSAGMAGTMGVEYAAAVKINRGNVANGCTNISAEFDGTFAPYVNVDATADAAADFLVAAFGVKVDLALAHLRLPLGLNVKIATPQGQVNAAQLTVKVLLDAAVRTLDGRLAAFARLGVCPLCTEAQQTIFSWPGFERRFTLFSKTATVSIGNIIPWFRNPVI
jgi:hypothetical protein